MIKKLFLILLTVLFILSGAYFYYKKPYKFNLEQKKKFVFWSIQLKPIYEKQLNRIISDFSVKYPDYDFVWIDIPIQEAQKRTLASVLSSNPPDLINLNPDFSLVLAQKNALEFFSEGDLSQFNKNLLNELKYNDKIYAVPFYATSPVTIYNKVLYNKVTQNSFPATYDELYSICPELYNKLKIAPFISSLNENDTLAKILNKYGIYSFENKGQIENTIKVYSMFNDMYKKGYLPLDTLTINHREAVEKYMSNQALSMVVGSNFINMIKQNAPDIYNSSKITNQLRAKNSGYDVSLMNLIIPKKAQNKKMALEFALLLTNKQNQLELSKVTNVLPVNNDALNDEYFKNCSSDLVDMSRCLSASQLNNIGNKNFGVKNKKQINELINSTLEEILLNKNSSDDFIEDKIDVMTEKIKEFMN